MLITNFSAGELSSNLFGRTDIAQYYSAASFLENFDIIPTGGIKNRPGTKRISDGFKDTDGVPLQPVRVEPFVLSRDEAYLVVFCHEKIAVYRIGEWDAPKEVFTNEDIGNETTLYTAEEALLVQHAQNGRMMVLAHKNHPPLEINFRTYGIDITIFDIRYRVNHVHSPNIISSFPREKDEAYEYPSGDNRHLKSFENYPSCVTFFNGRIVFACTTNSRQRLFFSRVNDINEFSTYKSYITEKKEYITVRGKIINNSDVIELEDNIEAEKFTKAANKYRIDSRYFDPDTRLLRTPYLEGNPEKIKIQAFTPAKITGYGLEIGVINEIRAELTRLSEEYENLNNTLPHVHLRIACIDDWSKPGIGNNPGGLYYVNIKFGVSEVVVYETTINKSEIKTIPYYAAEKIKEIDDTPISMGDSLQDKIKNDVKLAAFKEGYNYLKEIINELINELKLELPRAGIIEILNNLDAAIRAWMPIIRTYMRFQDNRINNGEAYHNYMPDIRAIIESSFAAMGKSVYIPIYTTEQIKDDYPTHDDGFTFEVASDRSDEIRWIVQNKNLIVGTESAEYVIPSNINAVNISAFLNSYFGSSKMQASSAGDALIFFRDGQKGLVEYHIPEADNYFRTNDLLAYAPQMLRESEAVDFDVLTMPHTKIIITRDDGKLVTLLYDRSFGIFAWGRTTLGSGNAKSLAVIPGKSGYDDIYLLVERDGNILLELLEEESKVYLDSYKSWDGSTEGYGEGAVIYDEAENKVYPLTGELPAASDKRYIGYPYTSRIKSMPVLTNNKMKPTVIKNLLMRFVDSYEPKVVSHPNEHENTFFFAKSPFTGIKKVMFPGSWERDVLFELVHEKPNRCCLLAVVAEVN